MKTSQNITIAVLTVSAVILLSALLGSHFGTAQQALGEMPFSQGDYMICTGAYAAGLDVVYVLHPSARRLNVYAVNTTSNAIDLVDSVDIAVALER